MWLLLEEQLLTYYVRFFPYLGANFAQIGESGNARMKITTNKSNSLDVSFKKLMDGVNTKLNTITKAELSQHAFSLRVSLFNSGTRAMFA